ncbi:MAG TPA: BTAD domain-containing putative transcriptional regulator, partial [Candidatus Dormibacteraeota bacterium]
MQVRGTTPVVGPVREESPPLDQMCGIDLTLVGGFQLRGTGGLIALPTGAERLLAFLALRGVRLQRTYVAGALWPDAPEARARANLRTVLWKLGGSHYPLVEAGREHLWLSPGVRVDLAEATEVARRVVQDPDSASLRDCRCRGLFEDLLPDWYDEWLIFERERFRDLRIHALEAISERMARLGRYGEAVHAGMAAVHAEPLRESAHRALISAHIAEGNIEAGIRQFDVFQRCLRDELGIAV